MVIFQKARESIRKQFDSTKSRCISVGIVAFAIITTAFSVSVWVTGNPDDAARGGAIVVAMSFYFLLRPNHIIGSFVPAEGKTYIERLLDWETRVLLSIMSVAGTLAWGFLDIVAARFIAG